MPRTRSLAWSELKIGIVSLAAIALAMFTIFLLGSGGFFWQRYSLKTMFDDVSGLKSGAPVRIAGVDVGTVSSVEFTGDRVEVVVEIGDEHRSRVTTSSRAGLGSVSLLGESAVEITPSNQGTPIPEWGYIPSAPPAGSIAEMASTATAGITQAAELLTDIRAGKGTVGKLLTDETLYNEINQLVGSAERVATQLASGRGTIGRLANDEALYREMSRAVGDLSTITTRVRSGEGSLGRLLNDPSLANSVNATSRNIEEMTARLNRGEGTAGKLLTERELYDRINGMVQRLETLTNSLNAGEGTAGALLKDKQLYENMNGTMVEVREFLAEVKKDPKKYLNVKVSIF